MCCGSYLGYSVRSHRWSGGFGFGLSVLGRVGGSWRGLNCWLISDGFRDRVPMLDVLIPEARRALRE